MPVFAHVIARVVNIIKIPGPDNASRIAKCSFPETEDNENDQVIDVYHYPRYANAAVPTETEMEIGHVYLIMANILICGNDHTMDPKARLTHLQIK